jgi:hypothetical protein
MSLLTATTPADANNAFSQYSTTLALRGFKSRISEIRFPNRSLRTFANRPQNHSFENPSWRIQAVLWQRYSVLLLMKLCSDFEAKSTDIQTTMRSEQTVTIPVSLTGMMIQTLKSRSRAQEFEFSSLPGLPTRCGRFETSFATCTAAGIVLGNEGLELLWRGRRACG